MLSELALHLYHNYLGIVTAPWSSVSGTMTVIRHAMLPHEAACARVLARVRIQCLSRRR